MIKRTLVILFFALICVKGYSQSKSTTELDFEVSMSEALFSTKESSSECTLNYIAELNNKQGYLHNTITESNSEFIAELAYSYPSLAEKEPHLENEKFGVEITLPSDQNPINTLQDVDAVELGIILPFLNESPDKSARFVEYYEGFLLALEEMKSKGFSANVYVFDLGSETGTAKLSSLLDTYEMKNLDLIIGGVSKDQIDVISEFTEKQGIKYVIPFPLKTDEAKKNPWVFQLNTPLETLYRNASDAFVDIFDNVNVIYITDNGSTNDKKEFMSILNERLNQRWIKANSINSTQNLISDLSLSLDRSRKNIIVAASGSVSLLQNLLPALDSIRNEQPNTNISLFGHTEWQTYKQFFSEFHKNDTYIFTPFYLSDDDYKTKQFLSNYQRWYNNKSLINTYPKYAALGYDAGIYFLTALLRHGKSFELTINSVSVNPLQSPIIFNKTDTSSGGYMNEGFFLIHYKPNGSIDKIEYGK